MQRRFKFYFISFFCLTIVLSGCNKDDVDLPKKDLDISFTKHWMQDLIAANPGQDITLKDISLPRAHDAGMYELNNCIGGNECNTQTQYLSMYDMLEAGVRVFDVRPTYKNGQFFTFHAISCNSLGCEGDELQSFLEQTRDYLQTHNELVIFELTHFCNTDPLDPLFIQKVEEVLGDLIYKEAPLGTVAFVNKALQQIIPASETSGKILLLTEGLTAATEDRVEGWFAPSFLPVAGTYANKYDFNLMLQDQLGKFISWNEESASIYKLCYTLTLSTTLSVECVSDEANATSIESLAVDARERLATTIDGWIADGTISKGNIPNIISVDYANTAVTEQCMRLSEYNLAP